MMAVARLPFLRLARTPRSWLLVGAWIALVVVISAALRKSDALGATDRVLLQLYAPFAMPLACLSIFTACIGNDGLRENVRRVRALGANGTMAASAIVAATALLSAIVCVLMAVLAVGIAGGNGRDLAISIWVSALGGATYAAFFSLGSAFGGKGGGRGVFLLANWFLANAGTAGSCFSPYAQIRSLLGGTAAGTFSQRGSSLVLGGILVVCALLAAWRTGVTTGRGR